RGLPLEATPLWLCEQRPPCRARGASSLQRFQYPLGSKRHMPQAFAGKPMDGVRYCAGNERIADLAEARGARIHIDELHLYLLREIRHAHHVIVVEIRLLDH